MKFVLLLVVVTVLAAHLVEAKKEDGEKGKSAEHRPHATHGKSAEHKPAQTGGGARDRRAAPADAGTKGAEKKHEMKHKSGKGKGKPKQ